MQMETNRVGRMLPSLRKELDDYLNDDSDSIEPPPKYTDPYGRPTLASDDDDDPEDFD